MLLKMQLREYHTLDTAEYILYCTKLKLGALHEGLLVDLAC